MVIDRPKPSKRGGYNLYNHQTQLQTPATTGREDKPLGTSRTIHPITVYADGSAHVHFSFDCTLQQLADGAYLTVADASLALGEMGLEPYLLSNTTPAAANHSTTPPYDEAEEDAVVADSNNNNHPTTSASESAAKEDKQEKKIVFTRQLVQLVAEKVPFRKRPRIDPACVLLEPL